MPPQAQSSATARTCIPRESTLPDYLTLSALHVRSQGGEGQWARESQKAGVGGRRWSHKASVKTKRWSRRRALSKDKDLFDGEARCKSVDRMTSARVVQTTVLPTDGRHQRSNREGGSTLTLLPASLEHGLLSSASRFPPLQSIILRLLWACRNSMIGPLHALCSHVFTCQKMAPERRAGTIGRRSSDLGHGAARTPQRRYYCFARTAQVALHWLP